MYQNLNLTFYFIQEWLKSTLRIFSAHFGVFSVKTKNFTKIRQICQICQIRFANTKMIMGGVQEMYHERKILPHEEEDFPLDEWGTIFVRVHFLCYGFILQQNSWKFKKLQFANNDVR